MLYWLSYLFTSYGTLRTPARDFYAFYYPTLEGKTHKRDADAKKRTYLGEAGINHGTDSFLMSRLLFWSATCWSEDVSFFAIMLLIATSNGPCLRGLSVKPNNKSSTRKDCHISSSKFSIVFLIREKYQLVHSIWIDYIKVGIVSFSE